MLKFKNQPSQSHAFHSWKKAPYTSSVEPLRELVDNSIGANATEIHIDLDFELNRGSIEDNGCGFPLEPQELERCFTFGNLGENTTDVNEHGEGFKTSIAKLDPTDKNWQLHWKRDNKCYSLTTSFTSDEHIAKLTEEWIGIIPGKSGTIVIFPFSRQGFTALYDTSDPKLKDTDDIIRRLRIDFEHTWMLHPRVMTGKCRIFVNGLQLDPFKIPVDYTVYTKTPLESSKTLSTGCRINLKMFVISKTLDNSWYRKTQGSSGFYSFKNGRFIQADTQNALYTRLYGSSSHNSHNGFIAIVNFTGTQSQTPPTIPTKNGFDANNTIFVEACEWIKEEVKKFVDKPSEESEDSLMERFAEIRRNNHADNIHIIKTKYTISSTDTAFKTTQLDAYEEVNGRINIYEGKKSNKAAIQDINQLFCNWVFACEVLKNPPNMKPVLLLDVAKPSFKLTDDLHEKIRVLAYRCTYGFPLQIWNYDVQRLYEFKV